MWTAESRAWVGDFGAGQALSDEQYALLAPMIPPAKPGGRPRTTDMRRMLDGLFYLVRTGCQWRHLPPPPAFPPWRTVYGYMRDFASAGVWEAIRHHLVVMLREPRVVWFVRENDRFVEMPPDKDGILRSKLFGGLWLDPAALLQRSSDRVREVLDAGLKSAEHKAFAARLAQR